MKNTTVDQLPSEIIVQIIQHLPTLCAIASFSQTNRTLHELVSNNRNTIFQSFVHRQFPTIVAHAPWQEAAFKLTSRSRAWDRRAFIARECVPPKDRIDEHVPNFRRQFTGFKPVIDSYEAPSSDGSREVLAWGAAGRLRLRLIKNNKVEWSTWSIPDDTSPHTDILDLRLMRPGQNRNRFGESVFIRRANRELELLYAMPEKDSWVVASKYMVKSDSSVDCVDVSQAEEPLLVVCDKENIQLFPVYSSQDQSRADKVIPVARTTTTKQRRRCAKFMSDTRIAVASQYLEGLQHAPIEIFDISSERLRSYPLHAVETLSTSKSSTGLPGRIGANILAKVDGQLCRSGSDTDLLLSGWSDGIVRLYDLRSGCEPVREYADPVDDGQIFSLLPVGQERFLAGSHQNACLKIFDMRMNARVYEYRKLGSMNTQTINSRPEMQPGQSKLQTKPRPLREINIFLALTVHHAAQPWRPLPGRQNNFRLPRYRGSIYSLSSPSPASPTVYAGIENHVIQLDFVNTDDWLADRGGVRHQVDHRQVLNLSCYERPRAGYESTDAVLLRKQTDMDKYSMKSKQGELGWDERWHLEQQRSGRGMAASWWSGRP